MRISCSSLNICLSFLLITHYQTLLYEPSARRTKGDRRAKLGKMPSSALTDLIVALLHELAGPCHRHRHGRHGGRRHRRTAVAPASPPPPPPSVAPHRRVLKRPPSPSPDRSVNRLLLSYPDAHPRGLSGRAVCPPRLGLSQSCCTGP
jgi:hypothetical protein